MVCTFDDYSSNDIFNQIIKYTISSLLRSKEIDKSIKTELKKQMQFFGSIDEKPPTKANRQKLVFNRNNVTYKLLIQVAIMLFDNSSVNEEEGSTVFKDFFRQEQMCKVYEMFILHFYTIHLDRHIYKVHAPKIEWHIDENAEDTWDGLFEVDRSIGDRRTDIVVENKVKNIQVIMDAKYYQKTFVNAYMGTDEERVRTGHLNQIRGYIIDSRFQGTKYGALVYPMTNNDLSNGIVKPIQDQNIIIKTINLNQDWKLIETDMLDFVHKFEKAKRR